ncbi:MAG: response regulator [Labilibaculum sp.]|nr:response regulator [Labilibaculum sp.]
MADGLSGSEVYCIGQDKYGFIWIGTENGLNIYDGIRFKPFLYGSGVDSYILENDISDLVFEGDSVWIGTRSGLYKMDIHTKEYKNIEIGKNDDVRTLFLEKEKQVLWAGTSSGLIHYDIKTKKYKEFNSSNSNISHDIVRAIYKDNDQNLWVGTFDKLNKLAPNSTFFETIDLEHSFRPAIKNDLILSIAPYSKMQDSLIWLGTQTGLLLFNRLTGKMRFLNEENSGLSNSVIKTIHVTDTNKLWLGTDFGLAEMNGSYNINVHLHDPFKKNSLVNSTVWEIFKDNSGAIWFGTNNGVSILSNLSNRFRFFPMSFKRGNNIAGYEVRGLMEDSKENLWMATQFGVVNFDPGKQQFYTFNSKQPEEKRLAFDETISLMEDRKGRIWIATNGGPVIWFTKEEKLKNYTANFNVKKGLRTNYTVSFIELEDSTILINTSKGLHKAVEKNNEIEFEFIGARKTIFGRGTRLWSYRNSELIKTDPVSLEQNTEINFEVAGKDIVIRSLLTVGENIVWLGLNNGLIQYDLESKDYNYYELKSNRKYPFIDLLTDNKGNIWGASFSAILKFSVETEQFEIYPVGEEILINSFTQNCCCKCKNGDLVFGGHDGFIRFSPEQITKSGFISPVKFTGLFVSNREVTPGIEIDGRKILEQEITFTENLTLDYASSSFSIEFSSLHFGNRNGIRYAYKLEEEDSEWTYINGESGRASYPKLRPGKYLLRVKGTNNDGVWNENETVLNIRIKPPLWASPLFIVFYLVLLMLMTMGLVYYYSYRAKMRGQLEMAQMEKVHTENIARVRQQFFTNISHEFRTPLSLIIGPTEKLAQNSSLDKSGKDFVRLIENNARRLLWLNNQLLDYRKLENKSMKLVVGEFDIIGFARNIFLLYTDKSERKHITYSFDTDLECLYVKMDLRKIETILFNLLSNAFKFTPENGEIVVSVRHCDYNIGNYSKGGICISVMDSGIGIPDEDKEKIFERFFQSKEALKMERGSGIGLTLVNEYVLMHQGAIQLKSRLGKGSDFQVMLPLDIEYSQEDTVVNETEIAEPLLKRIEDEEPDRYEDAPISGNPLILIVENDKEIARFLQISLKGKYNIKVASSVKSAFRVIVEQLPDLVISDIVMPGMDGIEFTRKFKNNPKTAHIPLILLTGQTQPEQQLEGLKHGADAYITKPFEIELLEVRIENFIKSRSRLTDYLKLDRIAEPSEVQITSQDEKVLEKIVVSIEKYISDPDLNVKKLCDETGLSHSILYRKIKTLTGQTVNEFIRTVRVRRAEQLLRTKKFSVSEVMYETGFSNHSYFSKCFRKLYKIPPKEYIEQV